MKRTGRRLNRFVSAIGCAAVVVGSASNSARAESPTGTPERVNQVVDLIEDAMSDRVIDASERRLILKQATRTLTEVEFAEIETRLNALPAQKPDDIKKAPHVDAAAPAPATQAACGATLDNRICSDDPGCGGLFDNYYIFGGFDAWSGPSDDDAANNFGTRIGFNLGAPLSQSRGIGGQFGMSYGAYNFHGRDNGANLSAFEGASIEDQIFITLGAFKRCNLSGDCPDRISWGLVYDHLITDNYSEHAWEFGIGQFRGQLGYALDCYNEVGFMFALHTNDEERALSGGQSSSVSALDQGSLYYRHHFCWGADTMLYVGLAEEPGDFIFGMRNEVPLSERCSLYANAQYILPSTSGGDDASRNMFAEEFWNVSVGFAFYPNCNAVSKSVCGRRWMPLLPVADNGSFAVDIAPNQL